MSCGHVKLHLHILNIFTKTYTHQNMLCFKRDSVFTNKTDKVKNMKSCHEDHPKHDQDQNHSSYHTF